MSLLSRSFRQNSPQRFVEQKFSVTELKAGAVRRPKGFVDFVLSRAKIQGDAGIVDEALDKEIKAKFPNPWLPPPPEPTWAEVATNFTGAMASWAKGRLQSR